MVSFRSHLAGLAWMRHHHPGSEARPRHPLTPPPTGGRVSIVAAGVPPAVEPGILPGGLGACIRPTRPASQRQSGRQDAALYGSQDGRRYNHIQAVKTDNKGEGSAFIVAAGVPPAVEPRILPGGLGACIRPTRPASQRQSGRQDAALYGSQDGRRYNRRQAVSTDNGREGSTVRGGQPSWLPVLLVAFFSVLGAPLLASDTASILTLWLHSQTNIQTWSAEVIQTRALKSLTQPLTASGHVWFAAPNRFRWELGDPPQTIAVRLADQMLIVYPRLKRAEKYALTADRNGPWGDAFALLEAGFPSSQGELESRFRVVHETTSDHVHEVTLQPRSASARRLMPQIKVAFATNDFSLRATELQFADGSTMRNDFTNAVLNAKLDESLFAPKLDADYKLLEPLQPR